VVELSNGDATSGLRRPLEAENRQTAITDLSKKCIELANGSQLTLNMYKCVLNTKRKLWSTNQLVTSFPAYEVI
jgi:hypothetical protein